MQVYGVLDGSTPIVEFKDEKGFNGAYLAANSFKNHFDKLTSISSLKDEVILANNVLKQKMISHQVEITKPHHLWTTCLSSVYIENDIAHIAHLGDTMVFKILEDDSFEILTKDTVKGIGERSRKVRDEQRNLGMDIPDEKYFLDSKNFMVFMRTLANKPNGYTVANGMDEVSEFIYCNSFSLKGTKALLLITDGLFPPNDNWSFMIDFILHKGIKSYADYLIDFQLKENTRVDDKTGLILYF